jgi:hypothetical protein
VKSAYKVARDSEALESIMGLPSCSFSDDEAHGFNWGKLWSLSLPNKVLHFLWRIATKSLRFHMKMRRRGMDVNPRCPMCFRLNEDGGHIFYKCKMVKPNLESS